MDKNLGPDMMDTSTDVQQVLQVLQDHHLTKDYRQLTAINRMDHLKATSK
jgi:hypothetical protein